VPPAPPSASWPGSMPKIALQPSAAKLAAIIQGRVCIEVSLS
jgi:hypothetical protein